MAIVPVDVGFELANDHLFEALLVQWHTPMEAGPHCYAAYSSELARRRSHELSLLANWIDGHYHREPSLRPLFIVFPEVSLPDSLIEQSESLLRLVSRPCVLIAGLCHLHWEEYKTQISNCPDLPNPEIWLSGKNAGGFVNAAIISISDGREGSHIRRFIQPKTHPYKEESAQLYCSPNSLLFESRSQISGKRLNFTVKICSDFVDPDTIRRFRQDLESAVPSIQIDLTFVLQWQPNPDAVQFKEGVKTYFEPPEAKAETKLGALFFVNAADSRHGPTSSFGCSGVRVQFAQRYPVAPNSASPTFHAEDLVAFDHQALLLRDHGPCAYHIVYRPVYLVNRVPGQGGELPFETCQCAFLDGEQASLSFVRLQPIYHWLENEWRSDESSVLESIMWTKEGSASAEIYLDFVRFSLREGRKLWLEAMQDRETEIRDGMQHYMHILRGEERSPSREPEPLRWSSQASLAAQRLMRSFSTVNLGLSSGFTMQFPARLNLRHAMIGTDIALTFLWGSGSRLPIDLLNCFGMLYHQFGHTEFHGRKWLLILVEPVCELNPDDLERWQSSEITKADVVVGDVVQVTTSFRAVCSTELLPHLLSSRTPETLCESLNRRIVGALG